MDEAIQAAKKAAVRPSNTRWALAFAAFYIVTTSVIPIMNGQPSATDPFVLGSILGFAGIHPVGRTMEKRAAGQS